MISPLTLAIEDAQVQSAQVLKQEELENWNTEVVYDEKMQEELKERFSYQYLPGQIKIPAKVSVSEVKRKQNYVPEGEAETLFDEEIVPYIPSFIKKQEEALTGAGRGTAYHKVFECLDLTDAENEAAIEKQIEKLKDKGRLTAEMAISVDIRDIWKFVQSSLGQRMKEAQKRGELYREQPFVLGINANELVEEYPADETILVQGIIDVFFYEEGEVVLVDYKTDHVYTQKSLISRYKVQMDYYAKALNQLTGLKVKEKYIYSVALQKQIAVI